ncbi:hypothetical protein KAFR_0E03010 [Kazachstania africana CBS 2517]|uniref:F-box/LRR-repeat protein 15-like leucin rich repeat domain-containing protein n=1 Tax=Kazachstania africana (strain ATCC 22294 / BCRC 22015 / CBS 2517 / CECT 1963 / NBRC 1671 / NRRL Y-8276) TaxID=1071382 RepID=H2AVQ3_KAZAF|nr:hypothetical protein KAFR_0E03010 [Kazachstania africana CBS 2517]CCF58453.1 hypothetical protein KAFR_0E03010 [Kazachstania africana CBS 2517]
MRLPTLINKYINNKRGHDSQITDSITPPPMKKFSRESSPNERTSRSRSASPTKYRRRHPYQVPKHVTISKDTKSLQLNTTHTVAFYEGLSTPVESPVTTPERINIVTTPLTSPRPDFYDKELNFRTSLVKNFADLKLQQPFQTHPIFRIPEILDNIIKHLSLHEKEAINLNENPFKRRAPETYQHALLLYKDEVKAKKVWDEVLKTKRNSNFVYEPSLYNCLSVNKIWYRVALPYLQKELMFRDANKLKRFGELSKGIYGKKKKFTSPNSFTLYKLHQVAPGDQIMEDISTLPLQNVKTLQFYICPNILPPRSWFHVAQNLQKVILPGNRKINDRFLIEASLNLTNLKYLDLRACENVSDVGIVSIALRCKKLEFINLGRHSRGELITDVSLVALGKYTNIVTLGMAGCNITDNGLWDFAQRNGDNVKRLSLNNCKLLTNFSIPYLVGFNYFPNLAVLEIKNLVNIDDVKWLVKFMLWKKYSNHPLLIESCHRITKLLGIEEKKIKKTNAICALSDMSEWINEDESL